MFSQPESPVFVLMMQMQKRGAQLNKLAVAYQEAMNKCAALEAARDEVRSSVHGLSATFNGAS